MFRNDLEWYRITKSSESLFLGGPIFKRNVEASAWQAQYSISGIRKTGFQNDPVEECFSSHNLISVASKLHKLASALVVGAITIIVFVLVVTYGQYVARVLFHVAPLQW